MNNQEWEWMAELLEAQRKEREKKQLLREIRRTFGETARNHEKIVNPGPWQDD